MDAYDSPWKDALSHFFPDFMAFYFPQAHAAIDWSRPYEFLEQELAELVHDGIAGKRVVDKLVRVAALDGSQPWLLIHVEVQGGREAGFAERVFTCHYRLYDRYRQPLASMAVLADRNRRWRPHVYAYQRLGCALRLDFPIVKLLDFAPKLDELLSDPNPFALVTAAHLLTQASRGDMGRRYAAKRRLTQLLYQRGWNERSIMELYRVIDWMMRLPDELTLQLRREVAVWEEEEHMRYITSFERIGRAEGHKAGRAEGKIQGIIEGRIEGKIEGKRDLLAELLCQRFGRTMRTVRRYMAGATEDQLERWSKRLLTAASLSEVFRED